MVQDRLDDPGFLQIEETEKDLGDYQYVQAILREMVGSAFETLDESDFDAEMVDALATRTAEKLLTPGLRKWNEPGGIDVFLAKQLGIDDSDPTGRVATALLRMLGECIDVATISGGVLDESWQATVDAILDQYTWLCLGVVPDRD